MIMIDDDNDDEQFRKLTLNVTVNTVISKLTYGKWKVKLPQ
jgi:hypothetical protein